MEIHSSAQQVNDWRWDGMRVWIEQASETLMMIDDAGRTDGHCSNVNTQQHWREGIWITTAGGTEREREREREREKPIVAGRISRFFVVSQLWAILVETCFVCLEIDISGGPRVCTNVHVFVPFESFWAQCCRNQHAFMQAVRATKNLFCNHNFFLARS